MSRKSKVITTAKAKPRKPSTKTERFREEAKLREEIRKLSLSNEELLRLAARSPPPPEFFEGDVEKPW